MKVVVITGSTRGIGYGLADSLLALGCAVIISGRAQQAVDQAVAKLSARHQSDHVLGQPCDVTHLGQVQALWEAARTRFGRVDIWINNAGIGHPLREMWHLSPGQIKDVMDTNLVGALHGAKVALTGMLDQGFGALYNMEGMGSSGRVQRGMAVYGCSKAGLRYLTDALVEETRGTPVLVAAIRPGMVMTHLLTQHRDEQPEEWERSKRIFNILADRVETVTPWLAQRILDNDRAGVRISWLTRGKSMARFLSAPFRKREVADD
jgi:NAD(P)-dependent dehydrogenase (short-subunit alcohol dehydrogenase family)